MTLCQAFLSLLFLPYQLIFDFQQWFQTADVAGQLQSKSLCSDRNDKDSNKLRRRIGPNGGLAVTHHQAIMFGMKTGPLVREASSELSGGSSKEQDRAGLLKAGFQN